MCDWIRSYGKGKKGRKERKENDGGWVERVMSDKGSSVTLIFYRVGNDWMKGGEPFLNLVAAAAQGSPFTHVEIALGEDEGRGGRMKNVLRVFNDDVGVVSIFIGIRTRTHTHTHIHMHYSNNLPSLSKHFFARRSSPSERESTRRIRT